MEPITIVGIIDCSDPNAVARFKARIKVCFSRSGFVRWWTRSALRMICGQVAIWWTRSTRIAAFLALSWLMSRRGMEQRKSG